MRQIWTERALWSVSLIAVIAGIRAVRPIAHPDTPPLVPFVVPRLQTGKLSSDSLIDATDVVSDGDLFRADRQYHDPNDMGISQAGSPAAPAVVRPALVLRGIVGGPDWAAIVEGIPGTNGATVLRTGRPIGGVSLRAVRSDTAILVGKDTTWKLAIRRVW